MHHVQRFFITLITLLFLLFSHFFSHPLPVFAQQDPCDPDLEQSTTDPLGYRLRGDRCEGRYIQEVGSTVLFVVSLTESFEEYDLDSGEELSVAWTTPTTQNVHLRAHGLRQRLYYRMDTIRPSGSTSYHWPIDLLARLKIPHGDLGVVGWIRYSVGGTAREVYLPLRISQKDPAKHSQSYQMALWPGKELTEVYLSLAPVNADGSFGEFLMDGTALEYGYYPAERGIECELSELGAPGVYYLEIGATLRGGGVVTITHWFYHAG
jgi:hypothetical protein